MIFFVKLNPMKQINLRDIIECLKNEANKKVDIRFSDILIVWGVTPFIIGLQYLIIFNYIDRIMAWSMFGPSVVISVLFIIFHKRRFWRYPDL